MIRVLCYGDSNTWGATPLTGERYPDDVRWTGALAQSLGPRYRVIEEGLNARTTVWDDPVQGEHKNGRPYLLPCLESHKPLDLVILMLGTNDLKHRFGLSAFDISCGIERLIQIVQASATGRGTASPQVLVIAPPPVAKLTAYAEQFEGAAEKSRGLAEAYANKAALYGCAFFAAGQVIASSDLDGIHLSPESHVRLGQALAEIVRRLCPA